MQKFSDNARAKLTASITNVATSLTIEASKADRFPVATTADWLAPLDWFKVVLFDAAGNREVVKVGTRASGSGVLGNLQRAQDGTTALAFPVDSVAICALTKTDLENMISLALGNTTFSGANTFTQETGFTNGVKIGVHWTIKESGTNLIFAYDGVAQMRLQADGAMIVKGDVTIDGAP